MRLKIKNQALAEALGYALDDIVDVECRHGIPVNREWRNRIKDAEIDGCVEAIKESKGKKQ